MHCLEPRAYLWLGMPHSCHLPSQSSLLCTSSSRSGATGTASVLTTWSTQCPTDVPSNNACEVGWEVIFQELPKSKETVPLSSDIKNCGYYWPLISDYCLFCMDHQNTLKYLAFLEIICCQSLFFEECFSCFIKPHPNMYWNWASNRGKGQRKRENEKEREKESMEEGNKAKEGNIKLLRKSQPNLEGIY